MSNGKINQNTLLWCSFALLIAGVFYTALYACTLTLPGFGTIVERCPGYGVSDVDSDSETERLLKQQQSLLTQLMLTQQCKVPPTFVEDIAPPPELKKSREVAFIIDNSSSMKSATTSSGIPSGQLSTELLSDVFSSIPKEPKLSLWRYNGCNAIPKNLLPAGKPLTGELSDILRYESGDSALVKAVLSIPQLLTDDSGKTEDNPANVVLISDGGDNCDELHEIPNELRNRPDIDISNHISRLCGAVRRVANDFPHLAIHVIALTPSLENTMQCVIKETGGWFIETQNPQDLRTALDTIANGG